MTKAPWEFHSDLSLDRLQPIAKVMRDTRDATLLLHDPAAGDGAWSLGCRIHERTGRLLIRAAGGEWASWLKVVSSLLDYVFAVGDVPVRYFHGDANKPGEQHLRVGIAEQLQGNLAFGDAKYDLLWRFVVESNIAGQTERVLLIGVTPNGDVECRYEIPLDGNISLSGPPPSTPPPKSPVQLPPAGVRPRRSAKRKKG